MWALCDALCQTLGHPPCRHVYAKCCEVVLPTMAMTAFFCRRCRAELVSLPLELDRCQLMDELLFFDARETKYSAKASCNKLLRARHSQPDSETFLGLVESEPRANPHEPGGSL